jgi:uncharacterized surface protein with fasciclin (FAS1) repeats
MTRRVNYLTGIAVATSPVFCAGWARAADIVDTAVGAGNLTTLVAAVKAAGLVDTLKGRAVHGSRATDAAFAALPAGTVDTLLKPENKAKLASFLTYHVLPGRVMSKDIAGKKIDPKTVEGQTVAIDASGPL